MKLANGASLLLKNQLRAGAVTLANKRGSEIQTVTKHELL
jgi:hypothetical protein